MNFGQEISTFHGDFDGLSDPERAPQPEPQSSLSDDRIRVLKNGDTFAVFDHYGDIRPSPGGEEGIYHDGTRFVSLLQLELNGERPYFLSSTVRDDNDQLVVALTNPLLPQGAGASSLPLGALHVSRRIFLLHGHCYQELLIENYSQQHVECALTLRLDADYADIYEIRGQARPAHGELWGASSEVSGLRFGYTGLDRVQRETRCTFSPEPLISATRARYDLRLNPREPFRIVTVMQFLRGGEPAPPALSVEEARERVLSGIASHRAACCRIRSTNGQFQAWIDRAFSDLHMMTTSLSTGPYPYAGVPWFNTPFGRDGLITALESLWCWPELARGVLAYLSSTQATTLNPDEDAEPGKILHETRKGEMAAVREMPFGRYYGSVDSTPLFVMLAGAYYKRTGDLRFIRDIWPHVHSALRWIEEYGDCDGDGFVEYARASATGLLHQGWKDADDAIFHADGRIAEAPIAPCEVQGYVYAAWGAAAELAHALGMDDHETLWREKAEALRDKFSRAFWSEDHSSFALALDGAKTRCEVLSSNAGQCLITGVASAAQAQLIAASLLSRDCYSGWGIRTLSEGEVRYNPMAYHNGSVWPHDNALIAAGFARYGLTAAALTVFQGMYDAALYFDLNRMPELFCGFPRQAGEGPVLYPVACAPQSWAAASVFLLFQSAIGLSIDGIRGRVTLVRPALPEFIDEVEIGNLRVAGSRIDLRLTRHPGGVSVNVIHRQGDAEVVVFH